MTLGSNRQPSANRGDVTLGVNAWRPLKGVTTANRGTSSLSGMPPTVRQPCLVKDGTPGARRALGCAPAPPQASPRGQALDHLGEEVQEAGGVRLLINTDPKGCQSPARYALWSRACHSAYYRVSETPNVW